MATPVTMPQLGETVVEGTITKWLKQEGDSVERDEPLFEISTDKVDTEVPSPLAGTLVQIKVQEGDTVEVGTELAMIDTGGDGQAASSNGQAQRAEPEPASAGADAAAADGGTGASAAAEQAAAQPGAAEPQPAAEAQKTPESDREGAAPQQPQTDRAQADGGDGLGREQAAQEERVASAQTGDGATARQPAAAAERGPRAGILSPLVRRLAEEHQVDLGRVEGTGTGGRITKRDVLAFVEGGGAARQPEPEPQPVPQPEPQPQPMPSPTPQPQPEPIPQPQAGGAREEAIPLTRMRQAIARNMVASIQTTARAWNLVEVNMENVARVRGAAKDAFKQREGVSLTFMPFLARAVCEALLAFPDVNSELREDQLVLKRYVNLGIAVALDEGLIVPVVKGADTMNIVGLARAINDVATRARSKKLSPDDVHGGTFTITNPGPFGSIISVPVINAPQCAILAFDAVEKRPVVIDDAIAIRHMVYLSMSWDHRIIDGATAAKFLGRLKQNLETWDFGPELGVAPRDASS